MLFLQNITYIHPNKDVLFTNIHLSLKKYDKVALIGDNGTGKSTLLKIIADKVQATDGTVKVEANAYYVPQIFGQCNHLTVAQALQVEDKLRALKEILDGQATEANFMLLNDDWTIEERCREALALWKLEGLDLTQKLESLSGGQKTKVFLAGITIHQPELVLLDEPSNHLDAAGRALLYEFLQSTSCTLMVVSHDRMLLNLLETVYELNKYGISTYGGNYDFYAEQKEVESNALNQNVRSKEKALRKAKEKERETLERQQKLDARGKRKQEKAGVARIMMNTLKNSAEKSTSKIRGIHAEKIDGIAHELRDLRAGLPDLDKMKFGFDYAELHRGKALFTAKDINFTYGNQWMWPEHLHFRMTSGERIVLKGANGSGKTTLIKIILGRLEPQIGEVYRAENRSVYIDQDYSLIDNTLKIYDQAQQFNTSGLQEHELKIRLNRFLFPKEDWDKSCVALSGGEKMRLMLCCLTISDQAPDMIILDEPTNNLDIQNVEILTTAINTYQGTLLVVSHDQTFLDEIRAERAIEL
ncbi:ABC-F family ATP-binding cassette domain-containing protein [Olivibacter sp. SDN3]|uniref:ABC-F family ATP-binding cassette domain-containing protein n=1 Tax=Olivibacter sp. SDN3 TaxID=2764720 RepID=UPI0016516206|nr:ABC-F family ATP-binding cassette domain-containing protein [Olivibacter sp. SDN3]QNL51017.1 ABC-F family ATP-binding cassette domain-containing protein [Olivibacter sp. SDN3]